MNEMKYPMKEKQRICRREIFEEENIEEENNDFVVFKVNVNG
jgi:hypothetical protein